MNKINCLFREPEVLEKSLIIMNKIHKTLFALVLVSLLGTPEISEARLGGQNPPDPFIWRPPPIILKGSAKVVPPGGYSLPGSSRTSIYTYYDGVSGKRLFYFFAAGQIIYYTYINGVLTYFYYDSTGAKVWYR